MGYKVSLLLSLLEKFIDRDVYLFERGNVFFLFHSSEKTSCFWEGCWNCTLRGFWTIKGNDGMYILFSILIDIQKIYEIFIWEDHFIFLNFVN